MSGGRHCPKCPDVADIMAKFVAHGGERFEHPCSGVPGPDEARRAARLELAGWAMSVRLKDLCCCAESGTPCVFCRLVAKWNAAAEGSRSS